MNRLVSGLGIAACVCAGVVGTYVCTARAGTTDTLPVTIIGNLATGSIGTARNSSDAIQYIRCGLIGTASGSTGGTLTAVCTAKDANPLTLPVTCTSTNPDIIAIVQNVVPDGLLQFTWNGLAQCTAVLATANSRLAPKQL
jgi:hypothetical protein